MVEKANIRTYICALKNSNFLDEQGKPSAYISFFYKPWNHANVFFGGFIFGAYIQGTNLKSIALQKVCCGI